MKKLHILFILVMMYFTNVFADDIFVNGYMRSNNTYVAPYYRTAPNNTPNDNWSTKGNINPYTGQWGTKEPVYDKYYNRENYYQQQIQSNYNQQPSIQPPRYESSLQAGYEYNAVTGIELYQTTLANGDLAVSYHSRFTNSYWQTVYRPDGNQYGLDEQGSFWEYQKSTGVYMNYGTGITCIGTGNSKTCIYPNYFANHNVTCVQSGYSNTCVYPNTP